MQICRLFVSAWLDVLTVRRKSKRLSSRSPVSTLYPRPEVTGLYGASGKKEQPVERTGSLPTIESRKSSVGAHIGISVDYIVGSAVDNTTHNATHTNSSKIERFFCSNNLSLKPEDAFFVAQICLGQMKKNAPWLEASEIMATLQRVVAARKMPRVANN